MLHRVGLCPGAVWTVTDIATPAGGEGSSTMFEVTADALELLDCILTVGEIADDESLRLAPDDDGELELRVGRARDGDQRFTFDGRDVLLVEAAVYVPLAGAVMGTGGSSSLLLTILPRDDVHAASD